MPNLAANNARDCRRSHVLVFHGGIGYAGSYIALLQRTVEIVTDGKKARVSDSLKLSC